jgi:hypothetical protein
MMNNIKLAGSYINSNEVQDLQYWRNMRMHKHQRNMLLYQYHQQQQQYHQQQLQSRQLQLQYYLHKRYIRSKRRSKV